MANTTCFVGRDVAFLVNTVDNFGSAIRAENLVDISFTSEQEEIECTSHGDTDRHYLLNLRNTTAEATYHYDRSDPAQQVLMPAYFAKTKLFFWLLVPEGSGEDQYTGLLSLTTLNGNVGNLEDIGDFGLSMRWENFALGSQA